LEPAKPPTRACRLGGEIPGFANLTTFLFDGSEQENRMLCDQMDRDWHVDQVERQTPAWMLSGPDASQ